MYSFNKCKSFLPLAIIPLFLLLNNCSDRSEYGEASDYEKLGATCIATDSEDVTAPTISSGSPTDNSTYNSVATTVAVTFSEKMLTGSVTTNTSDTTCSGSFQLSSDNFTSCIKMLAAPVASGNDTIFTITPASSLSAATTYKVNISTSATDISCNTLGSDNTSIEGFSTSPLGSGTITGNVQTDNGSSLSGVSVSSTQYGSTTSIGTTEGSGDYSKSSLGLGIHILAYSHDDYLSTNMTGILETDGQTLEVETVRLLPDNCTSGTMEGKITNAVTGVNMSGVGMWYADGLNKDYYIDGGFTYFGKTDASGTWSLSKSAGWYTINSYISGFYDGYVNVFACGDQPDQNNSLTAFLNKGEMRIILSWPKTDPVTGTDLDSHLQIPYSTPRVAGTDCDGDSDLNDKCHLYYGTNGSSVNYTGVSTADNHNYTDIVSSGDYVTLDKDHSASSSPPSPPGDETITISKVRSGTYSYSVHNYTDRGASTSSPSDNMSKSKATVKVFYNKEGTLVRKTFYVPNDSGTLWRVFTFNSSNSGSGFTNTNTMAYEQTPGSVY